MPPSPAADTAAAIESEKEKKTITYQQKAEQSTDAMLTEMMKKEGAQFSPKVKPAHLDDPNKKIEDAEARANFDANDEALLKNAARHASEKKNAVDEPLSYTE
ncbi:MAG TPA: hypothetical protein VMD74_01210 [Candidatus Methylomirabilis sp.]|nr:hypothetical protein [Candidatus Methylomirabilis sp.]